MREPIEMGLKRLAAYLSADDVSRWGIANTMRIAKRFNRLRDGRSHRWRGRLYHQEFDRLLEEHVGDSFAKVAGMHPRGAVLFLDSSRCFHYGSRDCVIPRYQMMYAFVSPCRTDFSEMLMTPRVYQTEPSDSRLRPTVLTKNNHA